MAGLAALIFAAPGAASAAAPELAGVTTIQGRGYLDVHLSRAVTVSINPYAAAKTYDISGGGKAAGVLLRQLGEPADTAVNAMAVRFAPSIVCHDACTKPLDFVPVISDHAKIDNGGATIPPGDYRLYALSDGPPANVTLRLPELTGQTRLAPTHTTSMEAVAFTRRDPQVTNSFAALGGGGELQSNGALLDSYIAYTDPHAATVSEQCWYSGRPVGAFAFYPGCPATDGDQLEVLTDPSPTVYVHNGPYQYVGYAFAKAQKGVYSTGGSITSAATVQSLGWAAFFVSFDGQPIDKPSSGRTRRTIRQSAR